MVEANRFYSFSLKGSLSQLFAAPVFYESQYDGDLLYGEYENYIFPVIFLSEDSEYIKNNKRTDFLSTGYAGSIFAISERVVDVLSTNNVTGWKTYPVEVYDKNENYLGGYYGFTITGRCLALKPSLAEPYVKQYPGGPENTFKGDPLNLDYWDGSDIFLLPGTTAAFMSKKARNIIKKAKLTNICFEDIAEKIDIMFKGKPYWELNNSIRIEE